ncbi:relaxin-3-like [Xyrauchen texanus]|uniref:relaxin-3-like n=1 Tax=Xyrauchen texanus TaxID=154827 RepID=UPI002241F2C2|nr:relaxin-3-like [Xyrauchen texanus]
MNMKWFASLSFLILLESSKTDSQDVWVKLCGREFIRMVVTSCGSSRLKRHTPDFDHPFANPHRSLQNWLNRDLFAFQKETPTGEDKQSSINDSPDSVTEQQASHQHMSPPAELLEHSTTMQDISLSSICCTLGCTMNQLIQYC